MKLQSIQALRGIAVLLVFFYHFAALESISLQRAGSAETPLIAGLWSNGYAGVDLFFVISGFIMVFVTGQVTPSVKTSLAFLFARVARVYPLWWFFAAIAALLFFVTTGAPADMERLQQDGVAMDWHLIASFLLLPQQTHPVLGVGWTLIHEMYFYIVFAFLLLAPRKFLAPLLLIWAGIVVAGSLAGLTEPLAGDVAAVAFYPMTIEFILGALTAIAVLEGWRWRPGLVAFLGVILFCVALGLQGDNDPEFLGWGRVIWFGPACMMLVYGMGGLDIAGRLTVPDALADVGDWSYAFYLSHMLSLKAVFLAAPVIAAYVDRSGLGLDWLVNALTIGSPGLVDNLVYFIAGVMAAIIVSWLTFRFVERPMLSALGTLRWKLFAKSNVQLRPRPIRASVW